MGADDHLPFFYSSSYLRFLNFKIDNIRVLDEARHPHMVRAVGGTVTVVRGPSRLGREGHGYVEKWEREARDIRKVLRDAFSQMSAWAMKSG